LEKNGRKMLFPEGVQVSSRGVNYTYFFAFQRGKNPQKQRSSTGGSRVWFLNVIAQSKLMYLPGKQLLNCDL
jgi:hypothetical protein